jgi:hypothetical protein
MSRPQVSGADERGEGVSWAAGKLDREEEESDRV